MDNPFPSRRNLLNAAQRYLLEPTEEQLDRAGAEPPRLTSQALKKDSMSRTRERILANLDDMYREAFATVHADVLVAREDLLTPQWTTPFPPAAI